jgi:hypothetical protein
MEAGRSTPYEEEDDEENNNKKPPAGAVVGGQSAAEGTAEYRACLSVLTYLRQAQAPLGSNFHYDW